MKKFNEIEGIVELTDTELRQYEGGALGLLFVVGFVIGFALTASGLDW